MYIYPYISLVSSFFHHGTSTQKFPIKIHWSFPMPGCNGALQKRTVTVLHATFGPSCPRRRWTFPTFILPTFTPTTTAAGRRRWPPTSCATGRGRSFRDFFRSFGTASTGYSTGSSTGATATVFLIHFGTGCFYGKIRSVTQFGHDVRGPYWIQGARRGKDSQEDAFVDNTKLVGRQRVVRRG